jgi:hypothetical protein
VLEAWLGGLNSDWLMNNEGADTWSPFDIVGHLIHGEKTNWMVRADIILSGTRTFNTFDRFAQFSDGEGKDMAQLLGEFHALRQQNIGLLQSRNITPGDLAKKGVHPAFGEVTLEQLLATWTAHDLGHIAQVARVMARQYKDAVGPWLQYLPIMEK